MARFTQEQEDYLIEIGLGYWCDGFCKKLPHWEPDVSKLSPEGQRKLEQLTEMAAQLEWKKVYRGGDAYTRHTYRPISGASSTYVVEQGTFSHWQMTEASKVVYDAMRQLGGQWLAGCYCVQLTNAGNVEGEAPAFDVEGTRYRLAMVEQKEDEKLFYKKEQSKWLKAAKAAIAARDAAPKVAPAPVKPVAPAPAPVRSFANAKEKLQYLLEELMNKYEVFNSYVDKKTKKEVITHYQFIVAGDTKLPTIIVTVVDADGKQPLPSYNALRWETAEDVIGYIKQHKSSLKFNKKEE